MQPWHDRRSPRLAGFDYSHPGPYFVTVCTWGREPVLGQVTAQQMHVSLAGRAVLDAWAAIPHRFPAVDLDAFVIMPNHIHGILVLGGDPGQRDIPQPDLAAVMRAFKSISAIHGNTALARANQPFWQRGYHDRVVRSDRELAHIRRYVSDNPARWETDIENPSSPHSDRHPWAR